LPEEQHNQVKPEFKLDFIKYFYVDDFDLILETGGFSMGNLSKEETIAHFQPWVGYGDYPDIENK
jgi:hypothetical protein